MQRLEYDREFDIGYLYRAEGERAHTVEIEPEGVYVDVDAQGRILGIEFLSMEALKRFIAAGGLGVPTHITDVEALHLSA